MGGGEDDDDHAPQVDFDAGDESTDDESDAGDDGGGGAAAVTVSAASAAATGADGQPSSSTTPSFDATNLNLNQAILKGLDVVKQHSGSQNGGLNSAEASTAAVTDAATANTPPSSVASVAGDPTIGGVGGGGAGGSAAVERGVESARESNEGSAAATKSHLDMDGSRRMIEAALGGGGNNNDTSRSTSRAASPVPPSDPAAKPAAATAAVRGYADVAGPSKSSSGGLANGIGSGGGGGGNNSGSYSSRALPPDPYKLGVYVPPHQRKRMVEERRKAMEEMEREEKKDDADDKVSGNDMDGEEEGEEREEDHPDDHSGGLLQPTPANMATQRQSWEELRKLINGTINRLNATTIKPLIHKLFDEGNLIRGRGLLAKTVLRAATTSPSYADVYAALVAVINTKLPEVGELVLMRTILQFQKAYKRRDKAQAVATANFLGQLFNQGMTHELLCLQLLTILLDGDPTDDSVEVAVSYMRVVGKALLEVSPAGVRAVMERFRGLLHDGSIGKRVQYKVEVLMKDRQRHFEDFPSIVPELDLVEADDQIMFELGLDDDDLKKDEVLDVFRFDPGFVQNEATWAKIRREILGEDSDDSSSDDSGDSDTDSSSDSGSGSDDGEDSDAEEDQEMVPAASSATAKKTQVIHDLTESDLVHLRRTIYLTIMSSATFEECTHKLTKVDIPLGRESELINMIIECCSQERTFLRYYGMIAARFCLLHPRWCNAFMEAFGVQYETIHRLETNKLRNVAKLFAHLLHTDSMPWSVLTVIHLNEDETTSSSRIFVKILVQEMAEAMGMAKLRDRFETTDSEHSQWYAGMFPRDVPRNTRYAINFFTSIGLGPLTDGLREHLKNAPKLILAQAQAEAAAKAAAEAEKGDDSSVSSSSSSSTSSGSSSSFSSSSYSSSSSSSYSSDSRSRGRRRGRNRGRSSRRKGGRSRRRRSYSSSSSSSSSSRSSYSSRSSSASSRSRGKRRDDKRRSRSGSRSRSRSTSVRRDRSDRTAGSRSRSRSSDRNAKRHRDRSRSRIRSRSRSISRSRSPPGRSGKRRRSYSSSRSRSRSPKGRRRDEKRDQSRSRSPSSGRDSRSARNRSNSRGRESRDTKRRRRSSRSRSGSRSRSRSPPRRRRRSRSRS